MHKVLQWFTMFCFASVSICVALVGCYWIAEHFYFDKFFYQKSTIHGYWLSQDSSYQQLKVFGKRGQDMLALQQFIFEQKSPSVLGAQASNEYTIALFGDSYVWGVGVTEEQRFAHLLEKKLNEYRPTKVLVYAVEGDNIIDQWRKYQAFFRTGTQADLFLFGVVHNDAFLKKNSWYGNEGQEKVDECLGETIWDVSEDWNDIDVGTVYPQRVKRSLEPDTKNFCIVQKLFGDFPKKNALYVDLDSLLTSNPITLVMGDLYRNAGFPVLTFSTPATDLTPAQERMFVSQKERHPSVLAHKMYAEEIIKSLMNDPKFGFVERLK